MKARTLVSIFIIVLAVLVIAGNCATKKPAYISKVYEIYGTWVNTGYNITMNSAKLFYHPNGKLEYYSETTATAATHDEFVITNKWADSKGNIWITMIEDYPFEHVDYYSLYKISNSGKTLEVTWTDSDFPTEIDPESHRYLIYYRQ